MGWVGGQYFITHSVNAFELPPVDTRDRYESNCGSGFESNIPYETGLYGLLLYYQITLDTEPLRIIREWFSLHLPKGTTKNVNTMSPFLTAAHLQAQGLSNYTSELEEWSGWVMSQMPRTIEDGFQHITYSHTNYQQLWDDTLMMTVLPLTKIGLLLNRASYVEEAKRQFLLHIKYLTDPSTGLWFHGK